MKRLLLSLICCSPLIFSPSISVSLDLVGPNGELAESVEQYGPVSPVETLWAISSKVRPDNSVSVQQTMVALYKLNPYAFYKANINKVIPESILKVPSIEFIAEQTDAEALALIRKYSTKKQAPAVTKKEAVKATPKAVKKADEKVEVFKESPALIAENELNKEKLLVAETKLSKLQAELEQTNEQFIVATEAGQALKLKLQPLTDEVLILQEQLKEEALVQQKLQKIIDEYRAQLDAVEVSPYSGEGLLNEILRTITSSLTNLLIVILSPVLLLLIIFVTISRIRAKRQLEEQEQELAESTAILMEESGQFDELLTDDFSDNTDQELDFSEEESADNTDAVDIDELDTVSLEQSEKIESAEEIDSVIDLSDDEAESSEDDPFGVDSLADDEELISSVNLDEPETSEDDPFGIGALADDDESSAAINLDEPEETDEDDPFGIGALVDDEAPINLDEAEANEDDPFGIGALADEETDLELSTESEGDSATHEVDLDDLAKENSILSEDELSELDDLETPQESIATEKEIDLADDPLEELGDLDLSGLEDDLSSVNPESLDETTDIEADLPPLDVENLEDIAADLASFDGKSLDETVEQEDDLASVDIESLEDIADLESELASLDIESLDETIKQEDDLASVDVESLEDTVDFEEDLLANQLSDVAFNEEVPLPKVDSTNEDDFIDIETLLENTDSDEKDEPYGELELELGLEEFPDVVDLKESVDIDDDENGIGAQLDLARAYLEIDDKAGAKELLLAVVDASNGKQRAEIDKLLSRLD